MTGGSRFFADTNLLLYSVDRSEPEKQKLAWQWLDSMWEQSTGRLSWQVLHEFYVNAVAKMGVDKVSARKLVQGYLQWPPIETNGGLIGRAWHWMDNAQVSYWDGLIVAAAEQACCDILLSEDLQAGRQFGKVRIVNPFRA